MSEIFVKPKRVVVDALEYLSEVLKDGLNKELQENQILCPVCKGTGLEITDQVYGLSNDPDKKIGRFPYHSQHIVGCSHCYTGVINLCEHCGKELSRGILRCDCEKSKQIRSIEEHKKTQEQMEKATILKYDDKIALEMEMLFSDDYGYNEGYFTEWEEFFEHWESSYEEDDEKPKYVWGTVSCSLELNSDNILESACDDLHEEAMSNLVDIDEFETFIKAWSKKQTGTETYWQSSKYLIEIPWKEYND